MAGKNIVEITDANFDEKVLKSEVPVFVDFWATWCGPCMAIGPTLEALADEFEGKIVIGKLNVDENRQIPTNYRITSIPTIMVFKGGQMVDGIVGARAKDQYKEVIEKHL
jgi:thioredoxin 1